MSTLQKNIGDNLHAVKHAKKLPQAYLFFPSLRQNHQYLLLLLIQNMRLKFFFKKVTIIVWKLVSCACTFIYDKVKTKKKQKIPNLYLFEMSIPKLSKDCKADAFCTSPWTFYIFFLFGTFNYMTSFVLRTLHFTWLNIYSQLHWLPFTDQELREWNYTLVRTRQYVTAIKFFPLVWCKNIALPRTYA